MKIINKILKFFRLVNGDNNLSLTNIACIIILFKLALIPQYGLEDLGVLFVVLLNYSAKKVITKDKKQEEVQEATDYTKMKDDIKDLKDKISSVAIATGLMRKP